MKRRSFLYILALCCLLQFTLPFHAVYAAPQSAEAASEASLFGDKILLCTAEGFKWVSWAELEAATHQPQTHPQFECGLCLAASMFGKSLAAVSPASLYSPLEGSSFALFKRDALLQSKQLAGQVQSRAPPHSIL